MGKEPWRHSVANTKHLPQRRGHFLLEASGAQRGLSAFKTGDMTVLDMLPKEMGKWTQKQG